MRKIEQDMVKAIKARKNWQSGNTSTVIHDDQLLIQLHGNTIAVQSLVTDVMWLDQATFRNWPTVTTASRLRALGFHATIKQGCAHINGKPV